jgi:hypothetical protein
MGSLLQAFVAGRVASDGVPVELGPPHPAVAHLAGEGVVDDQAPGEVVFSARVAEIGRGGVRDDLHGVGEHVQGQREHVPGAVLSGFGGEQLVALKPGAVEAHRDHAAGRPAFSGDLHPALVSLGVTGCHHVGDQRRALKEDGLLRVWQIAGEEPEESERPDEHDASVPQRWGTCRDLQQKKAPASRSARGPMGSG